MSPKSFPVPSAVAATDSPPCSTASTPHADCVVPDYGFGFPVGERAFRPRKGGSALMEAVVAKTRTWEKKGAARLGDRT